MTQSAVPIGDVSDAGRWTDEVGSTANLHTPLAAVDTHYLQSPYSPTNAGFRVTLGALSLPGTGTQTLSFKLNKSAGSPTLDYSVRLYPTGSGTILQAWSGGSLSNVSDVETQVDLTVTADLSAYVASLDVEVLATQTAGGLFAGNMSPTAYFENWQDGTSGNPDYWTPLMSTGSDVAPYVIFNPASGPGTAFSANWQIKRTLINTNGYMAPCYIDLLDCTRVDRNGSGPLAADSTGWKDYIDKFMAWYQPSGFYFDNAGPYNVDNSAYLQPVFNYVASQLGTNPVIILNLGMFPTAASYETLTPAPIYNMEAPYITQGGSTGWSNRAPGGSNPETVPAWCLALPIKRFSAQVWGVTGVNAITQLHDCFDTAAARHIGFMFVDEGNTVSTPYYQYTQTPSYWSTEIAYARSLL